MRETIKRGGDKSILALASAFGVKKVKCLVIGTSKVGRTSFCWSMMGQNFLSDDIEKSFNDGVHVHNLSLLKKKKTLPFPSLQLIDFAGLNDEEHGPEKDIISWSILKSGSFEVDFDIIFVVFDISFKMHGSSKVIKQIGEFLGRTINRANTIIILNKCDTVAHDQFPYFFQERATLIEELWKAEFGFDCLCVCPMISISKPNKQTEMMRKKRKKGVVLPKIIHSKVSDFSVLENLWKMVDETLKKSQKFYVGSLIREIADANACNRGNRVKLETREIVVPTSLKDLWKFESLTESVGLSLPKLEGIVKEVQLALKNALRPEHEEPEDHEDLEKYITSQITKNSVEADKVRKLFSVLGVDTRNDVKGIGEKDLFDHFDYYDVLKTVTKNNLVRGFGLNKKKVDSLELCPGLQWIGNGFDVVKGRRMADVFVGYNDLSSSATSSGVPKCVRNVMGKDFILPAFVEVDTRNCNSEERVYHSCDLEERTRSVGLDVGIGTSGVLSWIIDAKVKLPIHSSWKDLKKKSYFAAVFKEPIFRISIKSILPEFFSSKFGKLVKKLPDLCDSLEDYKQFETFFKNFGTHYVHSVPLGGYCMVSGEAMKVSKESKSDIAGSAMANIRSIIKGEIDAKGEISGEKSKTKYSYNFTFAGGERKLLLKHRNQGENGVNGDVSSVHHGVDYDGWIKSCSDPSKAAIIDDGIGISGIYDIVGEKKRDAFEKATIRYILGEKGYKKMFQKSEKKEEKKKIHEENEIEESSPSNNRNEFDEGKDDWTLFDPDVVYVRGVMEDEKKKEFGVVGIDYSTVKTTNMVFFSKHHKGYVYSVCCFPPNIIVSTSSDYKVCIFDIEKNRTVSEISDFEAQVYHVIKVTDSTFYCCSDDCYVRGYQVVRNDNDLIEGVLKILELKFDRYVHRLLKLSENRILCYLHAFILDWNNAPLEIIDTESKKVVKTLSREFKKLVVTIPVLDMLLSKKHENCFYLTTGPTNVMIREEIKLINYETNTVVKKFMADFLKLGPTVFFRLQSYLDFENNEILVAGANKEIFFFNTETSEIIYVIPTIDNVFSLLLVRNRYLLAGQYHGVFNVYIFDLDEKRHKNLYEENKFHEGSIYDLTVMNIKKPNEELNVLNWNLKICSCSSDRSVKVSCIEFQEEDKKKIKKESVGGNFGHFTLPTFSSGKVEGMDISHKSKD